MRDDVRYRVSVEQTRYLRFANTKYFIDNPLHLMIM